MPHQGPLSLRSSTFGGEESAAWGREILVLGGTPCTWRNLDCSEAMSGGRLHNRMLCKICFSTHKQMLKLRCMVLTSYRMLRKTYFSTCKQMPNKLRYMILQRNPFCVEENKSRWWISLGWGLASHLVSILMSIWAKHGTQNSHFVSFACFHPKTLRTSFSNGIEHQTFPVSRPLHTTLLNASCQWLPSIPLSISSSALIFGARLHL